MCSSDLEPDEEPFYSEIVPPGFLGTLLPWVKNKYQQELQTAADHYQASIDAHNLRETQRLADLKKWQNNTNEKLSNERQRISILRINYEKGDPNAVIDFITLMLNQNEFTPNIQRIFKLAFAQESKELVIEQELPISGELKFSRLRRGETGPITRPRNEDRINRDDLVTVVGTQDAVKQVIEALGHGSSHSLLEDRRYLDFRRITVSDPKLAGRTVAELGVDAKFGATISRVRRGDVDMVGTPDLVSIGAIRDIFDNTVILC